MAHFYDDKGNPVYEIEKKDGKGTRPTTIADARKLKLYAGVTEIIGQLDKPGLVYWSTNILLDEIIAYKKIPKAGSPEEKFKQWKSKVLEKHKKVCLEKSGRDRGSQLHDRLEKYILTGELPADGEYVMAVMDKLDAELGIGWEVIAEPEKSFAHPDGFGGKIDLHGKMLDGKGGYIVDFKTKNKSGLDSKCATDENRMQLAAYKKGLALDNAVCYNIYISITNPGEVYMHRWTDEEIREAGEMFDCLCKFWKLRNKL